MSQPVVSTAILLKALEDLITGEMGPGSANPLFKQIEAKPEQQIFSNWRRDRFPALYIWSAGEALVPGQIGNSAELRMNVNFTIYQSGTDKRSMLVGGGSKESILDLSQELLELLISHQTVNKTVTGLWLPVSTDDFSVVFRSNSTLEAIGRRITIEYRAENIDWRGPRNEMT